MEGQRPAPPDLTESDMCKVLDKHLDLIGVRRLLSSVKEHAEEVEGAINILASLKKAELLSGLMALRLKAGGGVSGLVEWMFQEVRAPLMRGLTQSQHAGGADGRVCCAEDAGEERCGGRGQEAAVEDGGRGSFKAVCKEGEAGGWLGCKPGVECAWFTSAGHPGSERR